MNFLAHLYLSGTNDPELLAGNFMADSIKGGGGIASYSEGMQRGVRLHHAIDHFTDTHPVTAQSKARLYPGFHKYATVIVDVYYDHFLAANWNRYSPIPLADYAQWVYGLLEERADRLPERTRNMLPWMKKENWLYYYSTIEGMHGIFTRMARRTRFDSKMELAAEALRKDYRLFEDEFNAFFPELEVFCKTFIRTQ